MGLSGLFEWFVTQSKYVIVAGVAYWVLKGFGKSKFVSIAGGLVTGGFAWYFMEHYETVLSGIGGLVGKLFGG